MTAACDTMAVSPAIAMLIAEALGSDDTLPHPRSAMPPGAEWLTQRLLRLALLEITAVQPGERLCDANLRALRG